MRSRTRQGHRPGTDRPTDRQRQPFPGQGGASEGWTDGRRPDGVRKPGHADAPPLLASHFALD